MMTVVMEHLVAAMRMAKCNKQEDIYRILVEMKTEKQTHEKLKRDAAIAHTYLGDTISISRLAYINGISVERTRQIIWGVGVKLKEYAAQKRSKS